MNKTSKTTTTKKTTTAAPAKSGTVKKTAATAKAPAKAKAKAKKSDSAAKANAFPLEHFLKTQKLSFGDLATQLGIVETQLAETHAESPLVMINGRPFSRATRYTSNVLDKPAVAISLEQMIKTDFADSQAAFAKQHGESQSFVAHAVKDEAVWLMGEVYQPISIMGAWTAVRLDAHVNDVCKGNETAFARVYQTSQQQMHRWLKRDCFFCQGEIFMRRTEFSSAALPVVTEAILLREFIRNEFGPGADGVQLFSREYNVNPQQVKRYIDYDALWINGDVYKNQSKFSIKGVTPDFSRARASA